MKKLDESKIQEYSRRLANKDAIECFKELLKLAVKNGVKTVSIHSDCYKSEFRDYADMFVSVDVKGFLA